MRLDLRFFGQKFQHFHKFICVVASPLFRKKSFEITFFSQQNASKFAIFIEKENQCIFFRFSFRATLSFTL